MTIHAIFENGVFKPTTPVTLPERCEVEFDARVIVPPAAIDESFDRLYAILGRRFHTGQSDLAARHNEHQP